MNRARSRHVRVGLTVALLASAPAASAQSFGYVDFSSTAGLQLNGSAAQAGNKLRLTPASGGQGGTAFSTTTIMLNSTASFSTFFSFEILGRGGLGNGADGLTFTVQTNSNNVGSSGGGLGYAGIPNSVAVEFDTFDNNEPGGSNHVGIDENGNMASEVQTAQLTPDFDNGSVWYAWVDYDGASRSLQARWASSAMRPVGSMLTHAVDLPSLLGSTNVYVGFTAGTGSGWGEHNVLSWSFVNSYVPGGAPPPMTGVPEPSTWALVLGGLAVLGAAHRRRRAA